MIQFGRWNRWIGQGAAQPDDNVEVAKNLDQWQEGYARPRDGLSRPSYFPGILHHGPNLSTRKTAVTFGQPIRSLLATHVPSRGAVVLPIPEESS